MKTLPHPTNLISHNPLLKYGLILLGLSLSSYFFAAPAVPAVATTVTNVWPMSGHDAQRTGLGTYALPDSSEPSLSFVRETTAPIVGDIVVSSEGVLYFASDRLYALDLNGSDIAPSVPIPEGIPTGSPAIDEKNGFVYFGFLTSEPRYKIVRFDRRLENPVEIDSGPAPFGGKMSAIIIATDGRVYFSVGRYPSILHSVGADKWSTGVCSAESGGAPVISDDSLYLMCPELGLHRFNRHTGKLLGQVPYGTYPVEPTIDRELNVISGHQLFDGVATLGTYSKWDLKLNLLFNSVGYEISNLAQTRSSLLPDGTSTVRRGSSTPGLNAVIAAGQNAWVRMSDSQVNYSSLFTTTVSVDSNGKLLIGKSESLVCLSPDDGSTIWQVKTNGNVTTEPVIASNGLVVVGTDTGRIYGYGGTPSNSIPIARISMSAGGNSAIEGEELWVTSRSGPTLVEFSAERSSDPDGNIVSWVWTIDNIVLSTENRFSVGLNHGRHTVRLKVTDDDGEDSEIASGSIFVTPQPLIGLYPSNDASARPPIVISTGNIHRSGNTVTADVTISNTEGTWYQLDMDIDTPSAASSIPVLDPANAVPRNFLVAPFQVRTFRVEFRRGEYLHYRVSRIAAAAIAVLGIDAIGRGLFGVELSQSWQKSYVDLSTPVIEELLANLKRGCGGAAVNVGLGFTTCQGNQLQRLICIIEKLARFLQCTVENPALKQAIMRLISEAYGSTRAEEWIQFGAKSLGEIVLILNNVGPLTELIINTLDANPEGFIRLEART